ncbi:MAG: single-stranded-DNA-specific exonuclease RecJ [Candidatus Obscuribacterales bacterium]|nr:single-stranded-DNA-specific exonuclease RecJ [Candidatus Obscuribacterales bacterium]
MKSSILASEGFPASTHGSIVSGAIDDVAIAARPPSLLIPASKSEEIVSATNKLLRNKVWKLQQEKDIPADLLEISGSEILARLLMRRGIDSAELAAPFLDPSKYVATGPMEFAEMPAAIMRISKSIALQEKITVYGDYDVDGVTATSVMLTVLRKLGANVDYYIPNRSTEGYGLNLKAVSVLASKHRTKLIISCDCGISNFAEINLAKQLGVDTIIVDHHSMPELLPPAVATLHPKQFNENHPLFHLPGVGVAYKLGEALLQDNGMHEEVAKLHDFVTLGMIADMVPLVQENRYLVQIGLPALAKSPRAGIRALLDQTVKMDGTDLVGFGLAPRINAVGRLSDANLAVKLMTTEDPVEAETLAKQLDLENTRRQELCEQIFFEADQKAKSALAQKDDMALAIYSAGWHHGVVGIVASRLVERYHRPAFVAELDEEEGKVKGSARGIPGIDLYQVLKENEHLMIKWGGHQAAAGFSCEADKADLLCSALVNTCNRMLSNRNIDPQVDIDLVLEPEAVNLDLAKLITKLGPFGMGNKKPVIALTGLFVVNTRPLGKEGKHHRIVSRDTTSGALFESVYWRSAGRVPEIGSSIDLCFCPESNVYNNNERLQLVLNDWRVAAPLVPGQEQQAVDMEPAAAASKELPSLHLETSYDGKTASTVSATGEPIGIQVKDPGSRFASIEINWRDLRGHGTPQSVVEAAVRRLGGKLCIFGESSETMEGVVFSDRANIAESGHLLFWQYPPSAAVLQSVVNRSNASTVYVVGGAPLEPADANVFLKRLLGLVRFAVNQRDGEAKSEKLSSVLSTTPLAVALGLTVLKNVGVIDWYAEDGTIFLELLGVPEKTWDDLPEYVQLVNVLAEIADFRQWCAESSLKDIQLALVPNAVRMDSGVPGEDEETADSTFGRADNGRATYIQSNN